MSRDGSGEARPATFEQEWKRLAPLVAQRLSKQGIPRDLVEDIAQEVGVRLYQRWDDLDLSKPLLPLAHRIARNRLVDHFRAQALVQLEPSPVGITRSDLTEERALSRLQLDAAVRALPKLSDRYRRLLLESGQRSSGAPASDAERTARTRARRSLKALMERTSGIVVASVREMLRTLTEHVRRARYALAQVDASLLANALAGALILITSVPSQGLPRHSEGLKRHEDISFTPQLIAASLIDHDRAAEARVVVPLGSEPHYLDQTEAPEDRQNQDEADGIVPGDPSTHVKALLGPDGLYYEGRSSAQPGDKRIESRYKVHYRNPDCVRRAYAGEISTDCSGGKAPRGYVEIEYDGEKKRVDYGKPTP